MPNVSKEFFLEDRNPSNWTLAVTEPVEEEEVATVVAANKITESEFSGTVAEFNDYLAIALGNVYTPNDVYDLATGTLLITKIYKCTQAQYDAIAVKDENMLYAIVGD